MENKTKPQTSIDILAEMTRRDMERSLQIKVTDNVNATYSPHNGWHLKREKDVIPSSKIWQDDYK